MEFIKRFWFYILASFDSISNANGGNDAYVQQKFRLKLVTLAMSFGYLLAMGLWGGLHLDHLIQPWSNGNRWLELLGMAGLFQLGSEAITFPVTFWSEFVVEHRFGLSTQTFGAYMWKWLKMNTLIVVFGSLLLAGLYAILWAIPAWWWLVATAGTLFVSVVLGILLPVLFVPLFYKVTPLADEGVLHRLQKIAEGTGLTVADVSRFSMSKETRKANAFMAGMGSTKHVMLADTLIESFTPAELDVVFAHEVGHYAHRHLQKNLVTITIITLVSFFVCNLVLTTIAAPLGHVSFTAPSALPLFFLVLNVFSAATGPFQNLISRHFERQADWFALERTRDVDSYKSSFARLAEMNKAEINTPRWKVILFFSHPPISERLAMAETWQKSAFSIGGRPSSL